jgi:PAS domain-containing protein
MDLTEYVTPSKSVESERRRFESLVESASSVIADLDLLSGITLFNHGTEVINCYSKSEATGKNAFVLSVPIEARRSLFELHGESGTEGIFERRPSGYDSWEDEGWNAGASDLDGQLDYR